MRKKNSVIAEKKAQLDIIEKLFRTLDDAEHDYAYSYEKVGTETEQAKHWRTGELLWEDDAQTIPRYNAIYDYVKIPQEELSDEALAGLKAVDNIRNVLEKLI